MVWQTFIKKKKRSQFVYCITKLSLRRFSFWDKKLINYLTIKLRIHIKSNGLASGILPRVIFAPDHIRIMACTTRSRQHDLQFSIRNKVLFQFTRYHNEISYQNENFIQNENCNDLYGNKISSGYQVNRFREITGDGINSVVPEWKSLWYHVNSPLVTSLKRD